MTSIYPLRFSEAIASEIATLHNEKMEADKEEQRQLKMLESLTETSLIRFKVLGLDKSTEIDPSELSSLKDKIITILKDEEDMGSFMVRLRALDESHYRRPARKFQNHW